MNILVFYLPVLTALLFLCGVVFYIIYRDWRISAVCFATMLAMIIFWIYYANPEIQWFRTKIYNIEVEMGKIKRDYQSTQATLKSLMEQIGKEMKERGGGTSYPFVVPKAQPKYMPEMR
jgi:ABC-type multidrug transport system fused ATPase/permease subunit